mgnify:CR=1 FL=1|jgi:hypothetical protein|tara:strand:- start:9468 stop:9818 length:351 start_codon:yes stop_codon:yes gene_type:complete
MYLISDFIAVVRELLKDEEVGAYRYTDESLVRILNVGITVLRDKRPDAFFITQKMVVYTVSDFTKEFPLPINFFSPMAYFVTGYAELRDDEYSDDSRATSLISKFEMEIGASNVPR